MSGISTAIGSDENYPIGQRISLVPGDELPENVIVLDDGSILTDDQGTPIFADTESS